MKLVCSIYILIVVLAENKDKCLVRCIANIKENELVYLSQKLNPLECLQLIQAIYEITPARAERNAKKHEIQRENLSRMPVTSKECLLNLEQWDNVFPTNMIPNGRAAMEMTLRWLGRPDLAKYVRENRILTKSLNAEDTADTLGSPGHRVSRRHTSETGKNLRARAKRKKTKKRKKKKKKKKKRVRHAHKEWEQNTQNKRVQKAMVAAAHTAPGENDKLKKKENHRSKKTNSIAHTSVWCLVLFILFFVIICLVSVYIYYKRNVSKARGTRFKHAWNENKRDKDTFTDCLEWNDEDVCTCSDIEEGCTGKCETCNRNYQTHYVADRRICTDDSVKNVNCVREPKKEEKKRQRLFSFFQRSYQKKKKGQENRDRKKILENIAVKKCEEMPEIVQKDQCKCCRCTLKSRDKILREKREIRKWKARRRKEGKRRKREELKRAKQLANVCFKETCK